LNLSTILISCENFNILPISQIFPYISVKFLDTLYDHQEISADEEINFKSKVTSRLFYHTFIHEICETYINLKREHGDIVILFDGIGDLLDSPYNKEILTQQVSKILKIIQKNLPVMIFLPDSPVDIIKMQDKYFWDEGEGIDLLHLLENARDRFSRKSYNFQNIKKFAKNKELKFLSENYFDKIKTKSMLYLHK